MIDHGDLNDMGWKIYHAEYFVDNGVDHHNAAPTYAELTLIARSLHREVERQSSKLARIGNALVEDE